MTGVIVAEWRRALIEATRYPMETISSMLTMFLVFAGLFYGASYITSSPIGTGRLSTIVVGYTIWMTMMSATSDMGWSMQNEAQNGTLEQVMLVPWPSVLIFIMRAVMAIVVFLVPLIIVVAALIALTHVRLDWRSIALAPFFMTLVTAWGMGLVVASVALLFKRIGQVLNIVQFLLLFVIMAPILQNHQIIWQVLGMLLPFTAQVALLHQVLQPTGMGAGILWFEAVLNMVIWMGAGVGGFVAADHIARRRGIIGHY